jgi:hypothetical protein
MSQSNQTSQTFYENFDLSVDITETGYTTRNGLTIRKLEGFQISLLNRELEINYDTTARLDPSISFTEIEFHGDAYGGVDLQFYDESGEHIVTERFSQGPTTFRLKKAAAYIIIPYENSHGRFKIEFLRWSK